LSVVRGGSSGGRKRWILRLGPGDSMLDSGAGTTVLNIDPLLSSFLVNLASNTVWEGGRRIAESLRKWASEPELVDRMASVILARTGQTIPPYLLVRFLEHPGLTEALVLEPESAANVLRELAVSAGVTLSDVEQIVDGVVLAVATSDQKTAQQFFNSQVLKTLDEVNAGLGFVLEELLSEILQVRAAIEGSSTRTSGLRSRVAQCEEAIARLWVALGVSEDLAGTLAMDASIGQAIRLDEGASLLLTAVAGSGKTMTALRTHHADLRDAVLSTAGPVPVLIDARFVGARTVEDCIRSKCVGIGEPSELGIRLVIDGLDEVSRNESQRLLFEAQTLAKVWPKSCVLGLGRPGVDLRGIEARSLPVPTRGALEPVIERISGRAHVLYNLPPALRASLELPLYAVAYAVLTRAGSVVHPSRAAILGELVDQCRREDDVPDEVLLQRLAVALTESGEVSSSAFGLAEAREVGKSRLVVHEAGLLRFAVAIYQEWFAAMALLAGSFRPSLSPSDPTHFDRWRSAIAIALAHGSESDVDEIAGWVLDTAPGGFRMALDEATTSSLHGADPGDAERATNRLRSAALAYLETMQPTMAAATPGFALDLDRSTFAISRGWASMELTNGLGIVYEGRSSVVPAHDVAWPWRLASNTVETWLTPLLEGQLLPTSHPVAHAEALWALCRTLGDDRSLLHAPIPARPIFDLLEPLDFEKPDEPIEFAVGRQRFLIAAPMYYEALESLRTLAAEDADVVRPWPTPDNTGTFSTFVSDLYSPGRATDLVRGVLNAAMEIYTDLVEQWFPQLKDFLATYATLPAAIEVLFHPRKEGFAATMSQRWSPRPHGSVSETETEVAEDGSSWGQFGEDFDLTTARWSDAGREIPPYSRAYRRHSAVVQLDQQDRPASFQAYQWLVEDLSEIGWLDKHKTRLDRR
jgi:hypothetical protein